MSNDSSRAEDRSANHTIPGTCGGHPAGTPKPIILAPEILFMHTKRLKKRCYKDFENHLCGFTAICLNF